MRFLNYYLISTLLNAIDDAQKTFLGKMMQESSCPEVHTLTNENLRYIMKLK